MNHVSSGGEIHSILRECHDPLRAATMLINRTRELCLAADVHFLVMREASLQVFVSTGCAGDDVTRIAEKSLASMRDEMCASLTATPLIVKNKPVGAIVLDGARPGAWSHNEALKNLASLLCLAQGGGKESILDLPSFLSAVRKEEQRSYRSGKPLSLLSLFTRDEAPLPPSVYVEAMGWIRNSDTLGRLDAAHMGLLLPETGIQGARIAAHRLRDHVEAELGLDFRVAFLLVGPENPTGDASATPEWITGASTEEAPWTCVPESP